MEKFKSLEKQENKLEKGTNIELTVHVMRHGDRDLKGNLEDYGRRRTIDVVQKSHLANQNFDAVKSFGSTAGPKTEVPEEELEMQRSLETAHIFSKEISRGDSYKTRPRNVLNYETMVSEIPFDYFNIHTGYANEYILEELKYEDKKFDDLTEEEKKKASEHADSMTVKHLMDLNSEDAIKMRKEVAGSFAVLILRYVKMMQRKLKSNQKLLFPLGSHTGMIEPFLAETVIWTDNNKNERHGATFNEIGGNFDPSEGFDILLKTNKDGKLEEVRLRFDNPERLSGKASLDMEKINEFAEFYKKLHAQD